MKQRIITALPLALIVGAVIGWAPRWLFLLVLVLAVEIALYEYFHISRAAGFNGIAAVGYVSAAALCVAQTVESSRIAELDLAILLATVFMAMVPALFRGTGLKEYYGCVASTLFGVLYLGLTLSLLMRLRFSPDYGGRALTLFLFFVMAAGDIFALLVGRLVGRNPLLPRISPRKTVEGSLGGLAGSLLVAWGFRMAFWQTTELKTVMLWAVVVAVAGQAGDLVESALKRSADLKDSGGLLPGHGGLLDRIDSLVFAVPALWLTIALQGFLN